MFRKPLQSAEKTEDPERSKFQAFDVVIDPGSEPKLKAKTKIETGKENAQKRSSCIKDFLPVVPAK